MSQTCQTWTCRLVVSGMSAGPNLADPLDNDPCPVAAFARALLAGLLVYLLPGSRAFGANVICCPRRSGFRIIIGGVVPTWIFRLHGRHPVLKTTT